MAGVTYSTNLTMIVSFENARLVGVSIQGARP